MTTNEELIGREDINDLEAILAVSNTDRDEVIHAVKDNAAAIFTWDYEKGQRPALNRLYEKAKVSMWNGETDLPWDTDVDQEKVVADNALANGGFDSDIDVSGTPMEHWDELKWLEFGVGMQIMVVDRNDAWLRGKFTELGVIQFEDWADTGEEYEIFALAEGEIAS